MNERFSQDELDNPIFGSDPVRAAKARQLGFGGWSIPLSDEAAFALHGERPPVPLTPEEQFVLSGAGSVNPGSQADTELFALHGERPMSPTDKFVLYGAEGPVPAQQGLPLPMPAHGGGGLPITPPTAPSRTPELDAYMSLLQGQARRMSSSPLGRFAAELAGKDPSAPQRMLADLESGRHKQRAEGAKAASSTVIEYFEKLARATPEQRKVLAEFGGSLIQPMLKDLGYDLPSSLFTALSETPGAATKLGAYTMSKLGKERAALVLPLIASMTDTKQVMEVINTEVEKGVTQAIPRMQALASEWAGQVHRNRPLMTKLGLVDEKGQARRIPAQVLLDAAGDFIKDPIEFAALAQLVSDDKYAGLLSGLGIEPGKVDLGAYEAFRIQLAKEATAGGQADISSTKARTDLTRVQTQTEPFKQVPGQGGALVRLPVPGVGAAAGAQIPGGGLTPQSGLTVAPGTQVVAQTPAPGVPIETAREVVQLEQTVNSLERIGKILETGDADSYIGPMLSGARFAEWSQKNLPAWLVGKVPDALTMLDQAENEMGNILIRFRTGAAVRIDEEPRLRGEVPDRRRDKPEAYRTKWEQTLTTFNVLKARVKELVGPDGRFKVQVGSDEHKAILDRHPLPKPLKDEDTPQVRVKSIRRKKVQ